MDRPRKKPRILVTDDSPLFLEALQAQLLKPGRYEIKTASDGQECLTAVESFHPDLIILGLTLSKIHGMDILKRLKANPLTAKIGIIISTGRALIQDYQTAIENGADYYLIKPFSPALVVKLAEKFFEGTLESAPFPKQIQQLLPLQNYYNPKMTTETSYMKLWGTRGSVPVSGPEYLCYGGNTCCLEICDGNSLVIIDAGTGIRALGDKIINTDYKELHLFIGHTHWDHIIGFPFFTPIYFPDYTIHIYAAKGFGKSVKELFKGMLDRDYFPVRLEELKATFIFHDLAENQKPITIGSIRIHYTYASHPGATLCFKLESPRRTIGYATDNELLVGYHGQPNLLDEENQRLEPHRSLIEFYKGCHQLIHEAQYTPVEYRAKVGWGHSSMSNATILMKYCNITEWIVTHHDPSHTDEMIRAKLQLHRDILAEYPLDCKINMAYDGFVLPF